MTNTVTETLPASFWHQPAAERTLKRAAAGGRLSRSYLLTGPDGAGKWAAAHWLAQAFFCRVASDAGEPCGNCPDCRRVAKHGHPDWHVLFPVTKADAEKEEEDWYRAKEQDPFAVVRSARRPYITIDRIRELIEELHRTAVEGGLKVVLVAGAEQMKSDVQAILLKSIEEPPPSTHFILTTPDPGRLLPTVVSRCQVIRFLPVDPETIAERLTGELAVPFERARWAASLSGGGWGNACKLAGDEEEQWREENIRLWREAFTLDVEDMVERIEGLFRPNRKGIGTDRSLTAFDIWMHLLKSDTATVAGAGAGGDQTAPLRNLTDAWDCWKILQNGRSTLFVNLAERTAVTGTFLELRRRLGVPLAAAAGPR